MHAQHNPDERVSTRESTDKIDQVVGPLSGGAGWSSHTSIDKDVQEVKSDHGKMVQKKIVKEETTQVSQEEDLDLSESNVSVFLPSCGRNESLSRCG